MVSAAESAAAKGPLGSALAAGVENLSLNDTVTFTKYNKLTSPFDGSVYWVKSDVLSQSALFNRMGLNSSRLAQPQTIVSQSPTMTIKGSFHYATRQDQNEAETEGVNTIVFSALEPIQAFNDVDPETLWIGEYAGDDEDFDAPITFAFSQRGNYYREADLFHYSGTAVLPVFKTQLIDSANALAGRMAIVSNSLPIWLQLNGYAPPYPNGFTNAVPLFPSFLVPDNYAPPYGVVHIEPSGTIGLQAAPYLGPTLSHFQLCQDRVRVTLYGLNNADAINFLDAVNQFSYDYCSIGLMSIPVVKDEKRTQAELGVIAQKKTIDYDVSYHQHTARDIARQLILDASAAYVAPPQTEPELDFSMSGNSMYAPIGLPA
jgi:hypothetical protein